MKQSDFQEQYHWMTGLSEYFNAIGNDRYELLYKALYHNNWYRKRDILSDLIKMSQSNPQHVKAWMNLLLHEHLEDIEIKPQLVVTLLRKYMLEDPLLVNTARFVDYWSGENGEAADMPDINDFLSRGQVLSKLWLVRELNKVVDGGKLGNVVFYGGWYNFIAHFLFQNFDVDTVVSIDLDERVVEPSKRLYQTECKEQRFIPITNDVSKLRWDGRKLQYIDAERRQEMIDEWMAKQDSIFIAKRQELIDEWLAKQDAAYIAKRQEIIDAWMAKQDAAYIAKRQEIIDNWMSKDENVAKVKQGIVNKDELFEKIAGKELRDKYFENKEEVFEKMAGKELRDKYFENKEAVFENIAGKELREKYFDNKEEVYANFGWRNVFLHPNGGKAEHIKSLDIEEFVKDEKISALNHKEIHCVINTSCEHMDNTWFENLPTGTFVVLHQNDYFDNPQHVNCCKDIEDVKRKYPMQEIYYEGSLDTFLYNRFMLIGVK